MQAILVQLQNDEAYKRMLSTIKTDETKKTYNLWLPKFFEFCSIEEPSALIEDAKSDPLAVSNKIGDYVLSLVNKGSSDSAININTSAIKCFFDSNFIGLNWKSINRFKNANKQEEVEEEKPIVVQAYEKHQLEKMLHHAIKVRKKARLAVEMIFPPTSGIRVGVLAGQDAIQFKNMSLFIQCLECAKAGKAYWIQENDWLRFWGLTRTETGDSQFSFEKHLIDNHTRDMDNVTAIKAMKEGDYDPYVKRELLGLNPYSEDKKWRYHTFVTPQATRIGRGYFNVRKRNGEKLTPDSYLLVNERNNLGEPIARGTVQNDIRDCLIATSIRIEKLDRERTDLQVTHSMRASFDTVVSGTATSALIKEKLLGHSIVTVEGIKMVHSKAYTKFKPMELLLGIDQLKGYVEAIDALTFSIR